MNTRTFRRTGWQVSEIGFGAWGIGGGQWGGADEAESMRTLHAAVDAGITFFDTADVHGDGLSERLKPLDARTLAPVQAIDDDAIHPLVHHRW